MCFQGYRNLMVTISFTCIWLHLTTFGSMYQVSLSSSIHLPISFHMIVMRLGFHLYFLFGCHFAISLNCCYYYLPLLWYCNGFHFQGQIVERSQHHICIFVGRVYYYYSDHFLYVLGSAKRCSDVVCRSVTTVSLFNSLDTNMKSTWIDTVWRWVSVFVSSPISFSFDRSSIYACQFEIFTAIMAGKNGIKRRKNYA